jgi:hypothetical protein
VVNGPDLSLEPGASLRYKDGYGYGTHMAGIIAGRDNVDGTGFRGIAPDAKLTSIKVGASNGAVDITQVMAAIDWAVKHRNDPKGPIRIINLSYGVDSSMQSCFCSPVNAAVDNAALAGIAVVIASGNTGAKAPVDAPGARILELGCRPRQRVDPDGPRHQPGHLRRRHDTDRRAGHLRPAEQLGLDESQHSADLVGRRQLDGPPPDRHHLDHRRGATVLREYHLVRPVLVRHRLVGPLLVGPLLVGPLLVGHAVHQRQQLDRRSLERSDVAVTR